MTTHRLMARLAGIPLRGIQADLIAEVARGGIQTMLLVRTQIRAVILAYKQMGQRLFLLDNTDHLWSRLSKRHSSPRRLPWRKQTSREQKQQ